MCTDNMLTNDLTGSACLAFLRLVCMEDQLMTMNYANQVLIRNQERQINRSKVNESDRLHSSTQG